MKQSRSLVQAALLAAALGARALLAADCNEDGVEDRLAIAEGLSEDCNQNDIPDECEVLPQTFRPRAALPLPATTRRLEATDLDGNGLLDLVVGSRQTRATSPLTILFGRADGSFQDPRLLAELTDLYDLVVEDLDRDGDLDLATANNTVLLVFENPGTGELAAAGTLALEGDARSIAAGDVDGDGTIDLVAGDRRGDRVLIFRGEGNLDYREPAAFLAGNSPESVALVDVDSDGALDLLTANRASRDLSLLAGLGDGTFSAARSLPFPGRSPSRALARDLDGDGALEILAVGASGLAVYQQRDGVFEAPVFHARSSRPLAIADIDLDGDLDLVTGGPPDGLLVRLNDGEAHFGVSQATELGRTPRDLAVADFDQDGLLELAILRSDASELALLAPGEGEGAGFDLLRDQVPLEDCADARGCRPHAGAIGDFDGDGDIDLIANITHPGTFALVENDGAGGFRQLPNHVFGGEHPQSTASGDLDGDGDLDAVTCDNLSSQVFVHLNGGAFDFAPPRRFRVGSAPIHVRLGDLDEDGMLDAVTANEGSNDISVLFGTGDGDFVPAAPRELRALGAPKAVALGDLNGDGRLDIAIANSTSPNVSIFLNAGERSFRAGDPLRIRGPANHVTLGDLDQNGALDLVASLPGLGVLATILGRGNGSFEAVVEVRVGGGPYAAEVTDFTGDGLPDLVTGNETNSTVSIIEGLSDGGFAEPRVFPAGIGLRFPLVGDFDQDGDLDLATPDREGHTVTVLLQQSEEDVPDFLSSLCTPLDFQRLSAESTATSAGERFVKFLLPIRDEARLLPLTFQNSQRFSLHEEFLAEVFPDRFPALDPEEYRRLVGARATREYFAGALSRIRPRPSDVLRGFGQAGAPPIVYGFSVFADFADAREALSVEEVEAIFRRLERGASFAPLAYAPTTRDGIVAARAWDDPPFPLLLRDTRPLAAFEAYTPAIGFGRVAILDEFELQVRSGRGELSFRDLLVLETAPRDLEGVVGGLVTAEPQGELSHLAVRTARRGTPNAFIADAPTRFAALEGSIVRLEVTPEEYRVREATLDEAERWWAANRPVLESLPTVDTEYPIIARPDEILAQERAGVDVVARFGGKAANFARLQGALSGPFERYRAVGFALPIHHYFAFLRANRIPSVLDPGREVSYEEYLRELFADERFRSDSTVRFLALQRLREHMEEEGEVSSLLVQPLATEIAEVFGSTENRVRFRSSSNIEDGLEFNGAGLYDSTSACADDDLDRDSVGPSRCDASRDSERGIARALQRVWASLWNFRAFEERDYYGIPPELAGMAVLVTRAFVDEAANGVAFTGNPASDGDDRFVVIAQVGEASVVSPEEGVVAERNVLEVEAGQVTSIIRARGSSLLPEGRHVLSDEELRELGALLAHLDASFPVDPGRQPRESVLLDVEFKLESTGPAEPRSLAVKQIRPFLRTSRTSESPAFELVVTDNLRACGVFRPGRDPRLEYEVKSEFDFRPGSIPLPTASGPFEAELVEELRFGPTLEPASPLAPGRFEVTRLAQGDGRTTFAFDYRQDFRLPRGELFRLVISGLDFELVDGLPLTPSQTLDEALLFETLLIEGSDPAGESVRNVQYSSCAYAQLPLWDIEFRLGDGTRIELEERFLEDRRETGPASLLRAVLDFDPAAGAARREITAYEELVYSAARHNERVRYWLVLEPYLELPRLGRPARILELVAESPDEGLAASARYLDEELLEITTVEVLEFGREARSTQEPRFERGDVESDGRLGVDDAVSILRYLFRRGPAPDCLDAADLDDNGRIGLVDAVEILFQLFRSERAPPPAPFGECGVDPSEDGLDCRNFAACEARGEG